MNKARASPAGTTHVDDQTEEAQASRPLGARFQELVVDEAQDCNPVDLEIIDWFRVARIPVKVICDPHQSIYGFCGGVTSELQAFAQTFGEDERLPMTGNFRSSRQASWRPRALELVQPLRLDPARFATADAWQDHARGLLVSLLPAGGQSINQRLRRNADLAKALSSAPPSGHSARTIHSVKGMEFPAVCVVMSPRTAKGILDFLSASGSTSDNEEARKIFVGASRAQHLLAFAVPKSQASRLMGLLQATGSAISLTVL